MANDWNRKTDTIKVNYDNGYQSYNVYASDVADAIRKLGFKSESDYEGNPFEQYRLESSSSNGNIVTHSKFETVISISLYLNNINITERIENKYFKWVRISNNEESDKEWNELHKEGFKELKITAVDVEDDTVFHCVYLSTAIENDDTQYDNIFNVPFETILATESISIVNQTASAELLGSLDIKSGNKNQIYIAGLPAPYSPDWTVNNLVIVPHCTASTITKYDSNGIMYNPNLFDENEYPNLNDTQYYEKGQPYITNVKWLTRNSNGVEVDITEDEFFSFSYDSCPDNRYLVIKGNFLPRDSYVNIICKFEYNDPFTGVLIPQTHSLDLSCISTGQGIDQLIISNTLGTSIHNNEPSYIELYASYFSNGEEIDMQEQIENPILQSSLHWYKRASGDNGWVHLDAVTQDENEFNSDIVCYEVRRYTSKDEIGTFTTEKTYSNRGGFMLRIYPPLIKSSDVIKAVFTNTNKNDAKFSAIEVVYDTTDVIQAYIDSSAGDKIYKNIDTNGTILTCMINYQGKLLENGDSRYGDDDYSGNIDGQTGLFDYYWFKMARDGSATYNIFLDSNGEVQMALVEAGVDPVKAPRFINIKAQHIDDLNMFQCVVIDKSIEAKKINLNNLERSLFIEDHDEE